MQLSGLRYYSPRLGRWVNRDPVAELPVSSISSALRAEDLALSVVAPYGFLLNQALNAIDPWGLIKEGDTCCCDGGPCRLTSVTVKIRTSFPFRIRHTATIETEGCCKEFHWRFWSCSFGLGPWDGQFDHIVVPIGHNSTILISLRARWWSCENRKWTRVAEHPIWGGGCIYNHFYEPGPTGWDCAGGSW